MRKFCGAGVGGGLNSEVSKRGWRPTAPKLQQKMTPRIVFSYSEGGIGKRGQKKGLNLWCGRDFLAPTPSVRQPLFETSDEFGCKNKKKEEHPPKPKDPSSPKGPSRPVFSTESDSVVLYYSVVNSLRIIIHYSKYSKSVQNALIHYIFSSESLRVVNSLQIP